MALPNVSGSDTKKINLDSITNSLKKSIFGVVSNLSSSLPTKAKDIASRGIESATSFTKNLFGFGTKSGETKGKKQPGLFENPLYYRPYLFRGNRRYALQTILQNIEKKIGTTGESPADSAKGMLTPSSKKEKEKPEGKSKGGVFGFFGNLANALKPFVKIAFQAAKALLVFSAALLVGAFAFKMFSEDINWGSVLLGVGILVGTGILLAKMSKGLMLGSLAMVVLAGAMALLGIALQTFSGLDWNTIAIAGASLAGLGLIMAGLGALAKFIALGAVALSVAALSLMLFGKAMEFVSVGLNKFMGFLERLQDADWSRIIKSVGMFSLAIGIMGITFAVLGTLIPFIFLGGIALTVMGGALWLFGKIIENVMPTLEKFFEVFIYPFINLAKTFIQAVENIFTKISNIFASLMQQDPAHIRDVFSELSWGLGKLAVALAAFGVGSVIGGVGGVIGSVFSSIASGIKGLFGVDDSIDKMSKLTEKATQLEKTQIAMKGIAESLELFNENIEKTNPEKIMKMASSLDFLSAALSRMSIPSISRGISSIFGESYFDKIKELSSYGDGVKTLSDAISNLNFSQLDIEKIDTKELDLLIVSLEKLRKVLDGFQTENAFDFVLNKIENVKRNLSDTLQKVIGKTPSVPTEEFKQKTPSVPTEELKRKMLSVPTEELKQKTSSNIPRETIQKQIFSPIEKSTFKIPDTLKKVLDVSVAEISPNIKPIPVQIIIKENLEDISKQLKISTMGSSQPIIIATNNNTVIAPDNRQTTNISNDSGESSTSRPMKDADSSLLSLNNNLNAFA